MTENSRPSRISRLPARFQRSDDAPTAVRGLQETDYEPSKPANARLSRTPLVGGRGARPSPGRSVSRPPLRPLGQVQELSAGYSAEQEQDDCDDLDDYSSDDDKYARRSTQPEDKEEDGEKEEDCHEEGGEEEYEEGGEKKVEEEDGRSIDKFLASLSDDEFSLKAPAQRGSQQVSAKAKSMASTSPPISGKDNDGPAPADPNQSSTSPPSKNSMLRSSVEKAHGKQYILWTSALLQKICTCRGIRGMSTCKSKDKMVDLLSAQDRNLGRSSPYFDDLQAMVEGAAAAIDLTPRVDIPGGLIASMKCLLHNIIPRQPTKMMTWEIVEYKQSDILAVIDAEAAEDTATGSSDVGASGSVGAASASASASRKTKHCMMKYVSLMITPKHRSKFMESRLAANRMELDNKATGSSSVFWKGLAEDFRDKTVELYDMWNEAKGKWNPCWANWKGESGNHQPWESFCRGNKDINMVGTAIEMYPELNAVCSNLLPEDARREFSGTRNADGTSRDIKPELSDKEGREHTKRKGKELYDKTRQGQKKKADNKRTKSIEEITKKSIESALSSLGPHLGASASGGSKWREHTEKLESQAYLLYFNARINEEYK